MPLGLLEDFPRTTAAGPTADDWAQYVTLLSADRLTSGQQNQAAALVEKLGLKKADAELHRAVIASAGPCEELIRGEDEAKTEEEQSQRADADARQALLDEISRLGLKLHNNDFPEAQRYNAARRAVEAIRAAQGQLGAIYSRWPMLFGLPVPEKAAFFWAAELPTAIQTKAQELGVKL